MTTKLTSTTIALLLLATTARAAMLSAGAAFPAWTLSDQTGQPVSSKDLAGKTYLLWFYPKAMTPGCTAEGDALRAQMALFKDRGVEVFGVSFDAPETNAQFAKQESFPFRLLSDTDRTLAVAVGAADSATQPTAKRISYLVGPDATVLKAYGAVDPRSHADEVLKDIPPKK